MIEVGIRDLKNALSRYLGRVRRGEILVVTDRGQPIARIVPAEIPEPIAALMAEGRLSWSGKAFVPPARPIRPRPGPDFSEYISEDR